MADKCPAQVTELLKYLKNTGTGKTKLDAIREVGCRVKGTEEFLVEVAKVVPTVTFAKIESFIEGQVRSGNEVEPVDQAKMAKEEAEQAANTSPVAEMHAGEAIEYIKNLPPGTSDDFLYKVVAFDSRVTVQRVAKDKLEQKPEAEESA